MSVITKTIGDVFRYGLMALGVYDMFGSKKRIENSKRQDLQHLSESIIDFIEKHYKGQAIIEVNYNKIKLFNKDFEEWKGNNRE